MSSELGELLFHIKDNAIVYNISYSKNILDYSEEYIKEYYDDIISDCWITARMLLNVFNQRDKEIIASFYHLENPDFGYHEFIILYDNDNDKCYMCESWCEKYSIIITQIDKKALNHLLSNFMTFNIEERISKFSKIFGFDDLELNIYTKISSINMILHYSYDTVINYHNLKSLNKSTFSNFSILS
jgi:hypothetical protein